MDFLERQPEDPVFNKTVHNALTESGLREWLNERSLRRTWARWQPGTPCQYRRRFAVYGNDLEPDAS